MTIVLLSLFLSDQKNRINLINQKMSVYVGTNKSTGFFFLSPLTNREGNLVAADDDE